MDIYLDTSVFGGYFDKEFKAETRQLFSLFEKGELSPVVSAVTIEEIFSGAPKKIVTLLNSINAQNLKVLPLTPEAETLADKYIEQEVVSKKYFEDALHVAISTVNQIDVLVSWNFKHIVNYNRIEGFNRVNNSLNYGDLEIRSPKEFYYG